MNALVPSLCLLLWCLVEVHSQTEFPYVSFMGETLPNNSYVDLSLVGDDVSGSDSVQCHTDLETCCSDNEGHHRGHWFAPGSKDSLPLNDSSHVTCFEIYGTQQVDMRRRKNGDMPSGIYRCDIFTSLNILERESVYIKLYYYGSEARFPRYPYPPGHNNPGFPTLHPPGFPTQNPPGFPTQYPPGFPTQNPPGFPTQNPPGFPTQYPPGFPTQYPGFLTLYPPGSTPPPPSGVSVSQNGLGSLLVSWTSGDTAVIYGYIIYYQQQPGEQGLRMTAGGSDTSVTISGLIVGATYSVSVVAVSSQSQIIVQHSIEVTAPDVTIERSTISLTSYPSYIIAGSTITLTCSILLPYGVTGTPNFILYGPGRILHTLGIYTNREMFFNDLTISKIATSEAGEYSCNVTLGGSDMISSNISVQIPVTTPSISVSTIAPTAGAPLILTCDYTLSPSVDTTVETAVSWMVNGSVDTSKDGRISTDGATLIFSPLTTSDTGRYTCTLTITAPQTPHVTGIGPLQSAVEVITVQKSMLQQDNVNSQKSLDVSLLTAVIVGVAAITLIIVIAIKATALILKKHNRKISTINDNINSNSTGMSNSAVTELAAIQPSKNDAYGVRTDQGEESEAVYEQIASPSKTPPSSDVEEMGEISSLPPCHDRPPMPLPEAKEEEGEYETISNASDSHDGN